MLGEKFLISWSLMCSRCPREQKHNNIKNINNNNKTIKQLLHNSRGPTAYCTQLQKRMFYPSVKKGGNALPPRRIQKLWACTIWMLRKNMIFFMPSVCSVFPTTATQQIGGLWAAEAPSAPIWVLQSQVFVFISTRINRLSRLFRDQDQVQLLAIGWSSTRLSIFTKQPSLRFFL